MTKDKDVQFYKKKKLKLRHRSIACFEELQEASVREKRSSSTP